MSNRSSHRGLPHHKLGASQSSSMDDLMSDPAYPFSASQETYKPSPALWDAKVYREECANNLSRLTDQWFQINEYPDPLMARPAAGTPQNGDYEEVKRLQKLVDQIAGTASASE